jgi:hypothetical protein
MCEVTIMLADGRPPRIARGDAVLGERDCPFSAQIDGRMRGVVLTVSEVNVVQIPGTGAEQSPRIFHGWSSAIRASFRIELPIGDFAKS